MEKGDAAKTRLGKAGFALLFFGLCVMIMQGGLWLLAGVCFAYFSVVFLVISRMYKHNSKDRNTEKNGLGEKR